MNRYRWGRLLGRGGMGEVYEGWRRLADGTEQQVALKRILATRARDPRVAEYFRREAQLSMQLAHPGIAFVYDFDVHDRQPLIVMECVDGMSLEAVARVTSLDFDATREIVRRLLAALAYLHGRGVAHRDVKPGNVLLSRDGEVKLTDLGLARCLDDDESSAGFRGTAAYASPEQLQGARPDAHADLYAVAAVAYRLVAGRPPFGGDRYEVMREMIAGVRPALPEDVPGDIRRLIEGALTARPQQTFDTAGEMAGALLPPDPSSDVEAQLAAVVEAASDADQDAPFPRQTEAAMGPQGDPEAVAGAPAHRTKYIAGLLGVVAFAVVVLVALNWSSEPQSPDSEPRAEQYVERDMAPDSEHVPAPTVAELVELETGVRPERDLAETVAETITQNRRTVRRSTPGPAPVLKPSTPKRRADRVVRVLRRSGKRSGQSSDSQPPRDIRGDSGERQDDTFARLEQALKELRPNDYCSSSGDCPLENKLRGGTHEAR